MLLGVLPLRSLQWALLTFSTAGMRASQTLPWIHIKASSVKSCPRNAMILRIFSGTVSWELERKWWKLQDKPSGRYLHSARVTGGERVHTIKMWQGRHSQGDGKHRRGDRKQTNKNKQRRERKIKKNETAESKTI